MKKLQFTVELNFSDKITDDVTILEIAKGIADAVVHKVDTVGIVPDYRDVYPESVKVSPQFIEESIEYKF